jgi:hypothetical protein
MNSEILYRKVGKRYQPAGLQFEADAFPRGAHLVVVDRGWQHVRYNVVPDHAALLAAAEPMRDAIRETVSRLLAMRPTRRPVTATQRAAWDAFSRAMGNDQYIVEYPAVGEIADAVMDLLLRHSSPAVGRREAPANAAVQPRAEGTSRCNRLLGDNAKEKT